ncbi:MAG: hypothetical protein CVU99_09265 [Firmicutes bacterium HGW-Firmicutes-4]|jgi:prepilin-type N-terminal cleavage/methylation domain-containing protein|nr:MAG: hypothetical protein CVU99_09265 [Firmicutes bacterium HGW-Firmicutes-4]
MNKQNRRNGKRGFTLIELLVALLITGMLMGTVTTVFLMAQKIYTRGENISYKQKSITNIETDLQNALARASYDGVVIDYSNPGGDYAIGFKDGVCVEVIGGNVYSTDQISQFEFTVTNQNRMNYVITPKDATMSQLKGGIIMNNVKIPPFSSEAIDSGSGTKYLVITYETGS